MKITDSMSDFEKEKAVYDWMTKKAPAGFRGTDRYSEYTGRL